MISKTFEIRDAGTFIPVLAVKLEPVTEQDRYLLARAGFGRLPQQQAEYVLVCRISGGEGKCTSDHHEWGGSRTMTVAHDFIRRNFDNLESGAVVDVEFILGFKPTKKESESKEEYGYGV